MSLSHEPSASLHRRRRPRTIDACAQSLAPATLELATGTGWPRSVASPPLRSLPAGPSSPRAARPPLSLCALLAAGARALAVALRRRSAPFPNRVSRTARERERAPVGPTRLAWENFSVFIFTFFRAKCGQRFYRNCNQAIT